MDKHMVGGTVFHKFLVYLMNIALVSGWITYKWFVIIFREFCSTFLAFFLKSAQRESTPKVSFLINYMYSLYYF